MRWLDRPDASVPGEAILVGPMLRIEKCITRFAPTTRSTLERMVSGHMALRGTCLRPRYLQALVHLETGYRNAVAMLLEVHICAGRGYEAIFEITFTKNLVLDYKPRFSNCPILFLFPISHHHVMQCSFFARVLD
jgi:hypothetical protein